MEASQGVAEELHRISRKNFPRRKTKVYAQNEIWGADLMDLQKYHKYNDNYKYVLLCVDVLSKYIWTQPLKSKSALEVSSAFERIFAEQKPQLLWTDRGKEFFNKKMHDLLQKHDIRIYHTYSSIKSSFAERAIRTIKSRIVRNFTTENTDNWTEYLADIVKNYNHTKHSVTGFAPAHVNAKIAKQIKQKCFEERKILPQKAKFKVGDVVRISLEKNIFSKSYSEQWSYEYYIVQRVFFTCPLTYELRDLNGERIEGRFYEAEMQKTKFPEIYLIENILKEKDGKYLVKWMGFDEPTWEDKKKFPKKLLKKL